MNILSGPFTMLSAKLNTPPTRFTRIRHYGFLATRVKTGMIKKMRKVLKHPEPGTKPKFTVREVIKIVYGRDIDVCQSCMKGALLVVEKWTKDRASPPQM